MEEDRKDEKPTFIEKYYNSSNRDLEEDKGDGVVQYKLYKTSTDDNINEIIDIHRKSSERVHLSNHLLEQSMKKTRVTRTKTADFSNFNRYKIEKMLHAIKEKVNVDPNDVRVDKGDMVEGDEQQKGPRPDLTDFLEKLEEFLFSYDIETDMDKNLTEKESDIIWRMKRRIGEMDHRRRKSEERCQKFLNANTLNKFRFTKNMKEIQAEIDSFSLKDKDKQIDPTPKPKNNSSKEKELNQLIHLADKQIELYERHIA